MVMDPGWQSLMVESDCKQAIELCVNELVPPWNCIALVEDIKEMAEERSITLQWIRRTGNKVADKVASLASKGLLPPSWRSIFPFTLSFLLLSGCKSFCVAVVWLFS